MAVAPLCLLVDCLVGQFIAFIARTRDTWAEKRNSERRSFFSGMGLSRRRIKQRDLKHG